MKTERFDFEGAEGRSLSGRLELPDGRPDAYAVLAHCFTCGKDSLATVRISRGLAERGIAVLRFDFAGVGDSEGEFARSTFSGRVDDLSAAAAAMDAAGRPARLLIGHSLGGAAALAAAGRIDGVAAVCTIGAPRDVDHLLVSLGAPQDAIGSDGTAEVAIGDRSVRLHRSFIDDLHGHDQRGRIRALGRPLLILHSPTDQVVGVENASGIFMAARHPKSFVALDGADHLLTQPGDADYAAAVIAAWASRYL